MFRYILAATLAIGMLILPSCQKEEITPQSNEMDFLEGILVLNQGEPGIVGTSLSFVVSGSENYRNVYEKVNDRPLEGTGQALDAYGESYYILLSDPGRIERLDKEMNSRGELLNVDTPYDLGFWSEEKAYAVGEHEITVFNPSTMDLIGTIPTDYPSHHIEIAEDKIFISQPDDAKIWVIDPQTDQLTHWFGTGINPVSMAFDPVDGLWVLCQGDENIEPNIRRYNGQTHEQELNTSIGVAGRKVSSLNYNEITGILHYCYNHRIRRISKPGVAAFSCDDDVVFGTPYYPAVHPITGYLYVTFLQENGERGYLHKFEENQEEGDHHLNSFRVGVNPIEMLFVSP